MLTLKENDGEDMKHHELISLFRSYSAFTNVKTALISFIVILLTYSVPVLICNDVANSLPDSQLQRKTHTYLPLMAWVYVFSFGEFFQYLIEIEFSFMNHLFLFTLLIFFSSIFPKYTMPV